MVANLTSNELCISDLNISIPPRTARDLDAIHSLSGNPRDSIDLKTAIKKLRKAKVIKDDNSGVIPRKHKKEVIREKTTIIKEVPSGIDQQALMDFIRKEIQKNKTVQQPIAQPQPEPNKSSEVILRAMMEKMDKLLNKQSSNSSHGSEEEIDYDIDPESLSEIHKKRVDKLVEHAENTIEYTKESTEDTFTDKDLDELTKLL